MHIYGVYYHVIVNILYKNMKMFFQKYRILKVMSLNWYVDLCNSIDVLSQKSTLNLLILYKNFKPFITLILNKFWPEIIQIWFEESPGTFLVSSLFELG